MSGCWFRGFLNSNMAFDQHLVAELPAKFGARSVKLMFGKMPDTGIPVYYIDAPDLYDRQGNPYNDQNGQPYADNHLRFALLGCAPHE